MSHFDFTRSPLSSRLTVALFIPLIAALGFAGCGKRAWDGKTATPIKHIIVLFQENRSFDHYFGAYPTGNGTFQFAGNTPKVNGLPANVHLKLSSHEEVSPHPTTYTHTLDVPHTYASMIAAYNGGRMDGYAEEGGRMAMVYYDERSPVVEYWKLAQRYTLCDNYFQPIFGPSTPAAFYLIAGHSITDTGEADGHEILNDIDPYYPPWGIGADGSRRTVSQNFPTVADLLDDKGVSWGWYQEGYRAGEEETSRTYEAHHNPFQYMKRWHKSSGLHGMDEFFDQLQKDTLPSVVFLKGSEDHDEHPGKSDLKVAIPWVADLVKRVEASPAWKDSVLILTWDESGGWYDHVPPPQTSGDKPKTTNVSKNYRGETIVDGKPCGNGPRVPCLIISPFAKKNYVCHQVANHVSILQFIEYNFHLKALSGTSATPPGLMDSFSFESKKPEADR